VAHFGDSAASYLWSSPPATITDAATGEELHFAGWQSSTDGTIYSTANLPSVSVDVHYIAIYN
ncbi:MAG: hypothetical protein IKS85_05895, partial [Lachnospiraceae bacterium]|nr:hypothetical protein [Lachnospiraceae bacterium]